MSEPLMAGRTVVVTGANTGIGKAAAGQLADLGARVVITARNRAKGEAALADLRSAHPQAVIELVDLDLADTASIERCAAEVLERCPRLDVLVNNAGLIVDTRSTTAQGFETTFGVNHLGPFLLTRRLLDRLLASAPARVVTVSSDAHRMAFRGLPWDDLMHERRYNGWSAYGASKLANVLFTVALAGRLEGMGVTANALHPGVVRTEFGQDHDVHGVMSVLMRPARTLFLTPEQGARTTTYLASSPDVAGRTGGYYAKCKPHGLSGHARDPRAAERLWTVSDQLLGLT